MGTPLDSAEEYLEDQHDLDSYSDYEFRLTIVNQIIKYLKSRSVIPTYGMVFDIEAFIGSNLGKMIGLTVDEGWHDNLSDGIRSIIRDNVEV